jgi:hypothetical protein
MLSRAHGRPSTTDAIHDNNNNKVPVDWPSVDTITDGNSLRKFLRWLNLSEGREVCNFQINVELVIIIQAHYKHRTLYSSHDAQVSASTSATANCMVHTCIPCLGIPRL